MTPFTEEELPFKGIIGFIQIYHVAGVIKLRWESDQLIRSDDLLDSSDWLNRIAFNRLESN